MSPTNVEVSVPKKNSKIEHYQLRWNGTWPLGTVFVIMSRQIKTRRLSENDTAVWIDMKQVSARHEKSSAAPLNMSWLTVGQQYTDSQPTGDWGGGGCFFTQVRCGITENYKSFFKDWPLFPRKLCAMSC